MKILKMITAAAVAAPVIPSVAAPTITHTADMCGENPPQPFEVVANVDGSTTQANGDFDLSLTEATHDATGSFTGSSRCRLPTQNELALFNPGLNDVLSNVAGGATADVVFDYSMDPDKDFYISTFFAPLLVSNSNVTLSGNGIVGNGTSYISTPGAHGTAIEMTGAPSTVTVNKNVAPDLFVEFFGDVDAQNVSIDPNDPSGVTLEMYQSILYGNFIGSSGDDTGIIGQDATVEGNLSGMSGDDTLIIQDNALVNGAISAGPGDNVLTVQDSAEVVNGISAGTGDDTVVIKDNAIVGGYGIYLNDGSDSLTISDNADISDLPTISGGDDYSSVDTFTDVLTFSGWDGETNGNKFIFFERINLIDAEISFADGALQVGGDDGDGLMLDSGSILDQSGIGLTLTGNLDNNATVTMQDGAVGDTITVVEGDYSGTGVLLVDIDTATDTSDTLVIDGDVTGGTTQIVVNNLSPGDATGNDIVVVSVAGTTSEGDFRLAGGPVSAGAFQYDLEHQAGDFVLVGAREPILSPTGAVYEATPHILLDGFTRMPTLKQRVGQRQWNSAAGLLEPTSGGWLRISGDWSDAELNTGTSYEINSRRLQAGFDLPVKAAENGQWVLGLTAQTGDVSASVATMTGTGSVNADSLGFGATATWYGTNDLYVDLQGQMNWASVDHASSFHGTLAEGERARTEAASIEVGRRFALDANNGLTPQGQLTWARVDGGSLTDSADNAVDMDRNDRVTGQLGLAYDYEWEDADQGLMQNVYAIANILHDFSNSTSVDVAGASLASEREATWGEIGLGGSMTWSATTTLYGEASYRKAFGSNGGEGLSATAGLRIQW